MTLYGPKNRWDKWVDAGIIVLLLLCALLFLSLF